jgi:regulator of nucleoside diphosphate kinase
MIKVTEKDYKRLTEQIKTAAVSRSVSYTYLEKLDEELRRAKVVPSKAVEPDIVTMNSRVIIEDVQTGKETELQLVYHTEADMKNRKISVFAPIGAALLGYKTGDIVEWDVPGGRKQFRVKRVIYQPEASGDLDL